MSGSGVEVSLLTIQESYALYVCSLRATKLKLVPGARLELARHTARDFKSLVSTNSTTRAKHSKAITETTLLLKQVTGRAFPASTVCSILLFRHASVIALFKVGGPGGI